MGGYGKKGYSSPLPTEVCLLDAPDPRDGGQVQVLPLGGHSPLGHGWLFTLKDKRGCYFKFKDIRKAKDPLPRKVHICTCTQRF